MIDLHSLQTWRKKASERSEPKRDAVNAWIRTSGEYEAVIDLDRALAAPSDEDQLEPAYDFGDHLHLNDAGYRAVAEAVDPADLACSAKTVEGTK